MSAEDRIRWDRIYRQQTHDPFPQPDPLLLQFTPPLLEEASARALDLAGGFGQNGLWLAGIGYQVDIMDISRVALQRARGEMAMRNLRNINLLQIDVDQLELDEETYNLVCVFRYLKRELFGQIKASIQPGGRILYETFNIRYLDLVPGFNTAFLLQPGELAEIFGQWNLLFAEENDHNSRIVAVKPS